MTELTPPLRAQSLAGVSPTRGPVRFMVTGSRVGITPQMIYKAFREHTQNGDTLVVGDARGVDSIAKNYWETHQFGKTELWVANWKPNGFSFDAAAGLKRNVAMIDTNPAFVLAFVGLCAKPNCTRLHKNHGSHGTLHAAATAERRGIPVHYYPAPTVIL